jgi:hypothetical protein
MTLRQKQSAFAALTVKLLQRILDAGYEFTYGDAFRDHRVHGVPGVKKSYSSANSVHKQRLALDINLFKDGRFLTSTEDHRVFGEWWEKQHPDARWGGRFNDGNHYSFEHQGAK